MRSNKPDQEAMGDPVDMKETTQKDNLSEEREKLLALLLEEEGISVLKAPVITPRSRTEPLPLSFAQQRLWFLHQLEPDSVAYNIPTAIRLSGPLDVSALDQSLKEIVRRHEALRTTFSLLAGRPVQIIVPPDGNVPGTSLLPVIEFQQVPEANQETEVRKLMFREARKPFDLTQAPLLRARLLRLNPKEHILFLVMHHIITDDWSMGVLFRELGVLYRAFASGKKIPSLPELPVQYADFAFRQRQWLQGDVLEAQLGYWKQRLADAPPLLELPTDRPRPAVQTFCGASRSFILPPFLTESLKALTQEEGATLFMTLLAAFNVLLYRYTGQTDLVVGSPIANRNRSEIEGIIGFFVNTLVLRTDLSGTSTFRELLKQVREVALGAYAHQDVPFERLVEALQPRRSLSHQILFQVMFALQNAITDELELSGVELTPLECDNGTSKFDLTLFMEEKEQGLKGLLVYNTDLFDAATIERMIDHLKTLLAGIVDHPDEYLWKLPLLTDTERRQLLIRWNDTRADYPKDQCIHQIFESQVARTPEATALVFENERLTYEELNCRANQIANYLRGLGVGPETCVGICLERSVEMVVALLGILKAGGAYVPLDPELPPERLAFILEDTETSVVLTRQQLYQRLPHDRLRLICMDTDHEAIRCQRSENLLNSAIPENKAYVLYTSGSTGKPKGVVIEHRSVLNLRAGLNGIIYDQYKGGGLRVSLNGPLTFDTSVKQWIQLLNGHTLYVFPSEIRFDGEALLTYLQSEKPDVLDCTPSQLDQLISAGLLSKPGSKPSSVLVAGEAIGGKTWQMLAQTTETTFYNLYGPTEYTVDTAVSRIEGTSDKPVIGRPIANTQVYLLDPHMEPVPVGVPGELYISGDGLARGYLNRPDLTAEKFVPHPFGGESGKRLYRSGDLARYLPDGSIEFLGRVDRQVKMRGFRIELEEIEAVLKQHPNLREAVVVVHGDEPEVGGRRTEDRGQRTEVGGRRTEVQGLEAEGGEQSARSSSLLTLQRLVAYIVPNPESDMDVLVSDLHHFVRTRLPGYMLPSVFVPLKTIPLTRNGKVDLNALPAPDRTRPALAGEYLPPRNPVEEGLAELWADVLKLDLVGIHDNFFELGGHSLLAAQLIFRANEIFRVRLPLRSLFEMPTVAGLAQYIETLQWAMQPRQASSYGLETGREEGEL